MKLRSRDWALLIGAGVISGIVGRYVDSNWWVSTALTMATLLILFPALKRSLGARFTFLQWTAVIGICMIAALLLHAALGT
jgi:hypothetical protein